MESKVMFVLAAVLVFQIAGTYGDALHDFNTKTQAYSVGFVKSQEWFGEVLASLGFLHAKTEALAKTLDAGQKNAALEADVKNHLTSLIKDGTDYMDNEEVQITHGRDVVVLLQELEKQLSA